MPSPRKRIGFLPSEEVQEIIEKLCTANKFSQSKVTGLLVEEALRSRGVLDESFGLNKNDIDDFINHFFEQETPTVDTKYSGYEEDYTNNKREDYTVNKKVLSDNIKMMHEFIEFKQFKKVMKKNKNIFE